MYGVDYSEIVGDTLLKSFERIFVINPLKDEVNKYGFKGRTVSLIEKKSLMEILNDCQNYIHKDSLDDYVKILSGNFNETVSLTYDELINSSYDKRFLYAKKLNNNGEDLILIFFGDVDELKFGKQDANSNETSKIVDDFSDKILKIYNVIDINTNTNKEQSPTLEYIKNQLEEFTESHPDINKEVKKNIIQEANKSKKSLLIVDDDVMTRNILKKTFENDYNIVMAVNGKDAIEKLEENYKNSELVLNFVGIFLDLTMPVLDGFAVLDYLTNNGLIFKMPVIIISAAEDKDTKRRVYSYNIADMLEKPFNLEIIKLRITNFIKLYKNSNILNSLVINKDKNIDIIINKLVEVYLDENKEKICYVEKLTRIISTKYLELYPESHLSEPLIDKIVDASKYYNVGTKLLTKADLVDLEKQKKHVGYGKVIISKYFEGNQDKLLREYAENICLYHHECFDGTGYVEDIKESKIPVYVSFVSLAAMYVNQYFKEKNTNHSLIASSIISLENKNFSPELIKAFREVLGNFATAFSDFN